MSRENVEIVRRGYEALNAGDIEGMFRLCDPKLEVHLARDAGTVLGLDFSETYHGVEGFMRFLGRLAAAWESVRWEPEDYVDADDDVVVLIRMVATGKESGIDIEQPMAHLCTLRDGKLVRHETFWERAAALEAAGL